MEEGEEEEIVRLETRFNWLESKGRTAFNQFFANQVASFTNFFTHNGIGVFWYTAGKMSMLVKTF